MGEIHQEMNELLDKQVNTQKESLKNLLGSTQLLKLLQAHKKVYNENVRNKIERKNDTHLKYF